MFQVHTIMQGCSIQRVVSWAITDTTTGRCSGLDAGIGACSQDRQFAPHGVTINSELIGIHFRLLLQEGQGSTCP